MIFLNQLSHVYIEIFIPAWLRSWQDTILCEEVCH